MMALNRLRLNHLVRKGNRSAKLTAKLLSKTDQLLGSILFGNTLINAAAATGAKGVVIAGVGNGNMTKAALDACAAAAQKGVVCVRSSRVTRTVASTASSRAPSCSQSATVSTIDRVDNGGGMPFWIDS